MDNILDIAFFLFKSLIARGLEVKKSFHNTYFFYRVDRNGEMIANIKITLNDQIETYNVWKFYQIGSMKSARRFLMELDAE